MHTEGTEAVPRDTYKTTLHARQHTYCVFLYIFYVSCGARKYLTESYIY